MASHGQLEVARWAPMVSSNRDAIGSMPSKEATSGAESRVASRRTEPNMMADEDNVVQALLIKGVALVVVYFILVQVLPTPPPRV